MVKIVSRLHKNWLAFVVGGSRPRFGNSTDANEEFTPAPIK